MQAAAAIVAANSDVVAGHLFDSSLLSVPADVLLHYILGRLPLCALVACGLVCKHLQCYSKKALKIIEESDNSKTKTGKLWRHVCPRWVPVLLSAYEYTTVDFLRWLQSYLKYPLLGEDDYYERYRFRIFATLEKGAVIAATKGTVSMQDDIHALFMQFTAIENNTDVLLSTRDAIKQKTDGYYAALLQEGCFYVKAAEQGHLELLQSAMKDFTRLRDDPMGIDAAVRKHMLLYLKECEHHIIEAAACGGHLDVIRWAKDDKQFFNAQKIVFSAAKYGQVHVIEWIFKSTDKGGAGVTFPLSGDGNSTCYETEQEMGKDICVAASAHKNPQMLEWAINKGYQLVVPKCFAAAVRANSIETAKFIVSVAERNQQLIDHFTDVPRAYGYLMRDIIRCGYLEMTQWICTHFPEDSTIVWLQNDTSWVFHAVNSGNLEMLQWFLARGISWHPQVFDWAIDCGHVHMLQWLFEQKGRYQLPLDENGLYGLDDMLRMPPIPVLLWMASCGMIRPLAEHQLQQYRVIQRQEAITEWLIERRKNRRISQRVNLFF